MSFAHGYDGTRLWYDVLGQNGDPILLISGNGCDHHTWDDVREELAQKHRVIVYDHRGTGQSEDNFPEHWTTRDFARDALEVLRTAGLGRAHIYGHSMGGRIAQWLAADAPDHVATLVLGASSPGGINAIPRSAEATAGMLSGDMAVIERMCHTDEWIAANSGLKSASTPNPCSRGALGKHLKASFDHDAWEVLPSITAPTLVIHGDDDQLTPAENSQLLADRIPKAHLMNVNGARHVYWAGFPEVQAALLDFFRNHAL